MDSHGESYSDDEFDEYASDGFESDDDQVEMNAEGGNESALRASANAPIAWKQGEQVQVWWADENEWYDGKIAQFEPKTAQVLVKYDDGDCAWEVGEAALHLLIPHKPCISSTL